MIKYGEHTSLTVLEGWCCCVTEDSSNILCNQVVAMAIKPQPSLKHLSTQHKKKYVKWLHTQNVEVKVGWGV